MSGARWLPRTRHFRIWLYRSQSLIQPKRQDNVSAALGLLRFKGLLADEEAALARRSRTSEDPRVRKAASTLQAARNALAVAYHNETGEPAHLETLLQAVNQAELALGKASRDYREHLQVKGANLDDLQAKLSKGSALVDFRRYERIAFGKGYAEARWAAVVIEGFETIRVVDLGEIDDTADQVRTVMLEAGDVNSAAKSLYERLITRLKLPQRINRLYLAPDSDLHLLPFHRLMDNEGAYLGERYELRRIQSARDLLKPVHDQPARGLLALGGIDFGSLPRKLDTIKPGAFENKSELPAEVQRATAEAFRGGFAPLANTGPEIQMIEAMYRQARPAEATELWQNDEATETRLKKLKNAPRVLHLATHGFYRAARTRNARPMLLAGITLAGANEALNGQSDDGILYALEVQDLNLEGTELVVLSACETAQGEIAHGEGVYGLVRALRTAGARNVLVTLRPIDDASAPKFMEQFYERWLDQSPGSSDPAKALQDTQAYYLAKEPDFDWSPYIMVGR